MMGASPLGQFNYTLYISVCLIPGRFRFSSWLRWCLEGLMDQSIFWGVSYGAPLVVRIKPRDIFPSDGETKGRRRAGRRRA